MQRDRKLDREHGWGGGVGEETAFDGNWKNYSYFSIKHSAAS